jgi:hypothetical protein
MIGNLGTPWPRIIARAEPDEPYAFRFAPLLGPVAALPSAPFHPVG